MPEALFPEGSITRRINRENVLLLGGGRALLMQLAHPKVALGVDEHSDFRQKPMYRLRRTIRMIMAIVFGDHQTSMSAARSVNKVHAGVRGDGYRALDPELLLWVHATLVDTALVAYETFVQRLEEGEREDFYQEMKLLGEVLGVPRNMFPPGIADFDRYVDAQISNGPVRVSPLALELGKLVLRPRILKLPGRVFVPWEIITSGLLPSHLRRQYGLRWGPTQRRLYSVAVKSVPRIVAVTPPILRVWPRPGRNVTISA